MTSRARTGSGQRPTDADRSWRRGSLEEAAMGITSEIPVGASFDLGAHTVGLERETGRAVFVARTPGRPPNRIVGYTVQSSAIDGPPPHGGEMHPDADRS